MTESIRSLGRKVYDLPKLLYNIIVTESIRSLGRKVYDLPKLL